MTSHSIKVIKNSFMSVPLISVKFISEIKLILPFLLKALYFILQIIIFGYGPLESVQTSQMQIIGFQFVFTFHIQRIKCSLKMLNFSSPLLIIVKSLKTSNF